jgi:hypothetical protein
MEHFTPISASIGGVLIGLSATMLWLANGRDQRGWYRRYSPWRRVVHDDGHRNQGRNSTPGNIVLASD